MSYKGRKIETIRLHDECGVYYNAILDGVPAVMYASSEEQAIEISKLIIEAQ